MKWMSLIIAFTFLSSQSTYACDDYDKLVKKLTKGFYEQRIFNGFNDPRCRFTR